MRIKKTAVLISVCAVLLVSLCCALLIPTLADEYDPALADTYYSVSVSANDTKMGTVSVKPKEAADRNEDGNFRYYTTVVLKAEPASGYEFVRWVGSDGSSSQASTLEYEITGNASFHAEFRACVYNINYDNSVYKFTMFPADAPAPTQYTYGTEITLPLPVNNHAGYTFAGWNISSVNAKGESFAYVSEYPPIDGNDDNFKILVGVCYGDITLSPIYNANPFEVTFVDKVGNTLGTELGRTPHFDAAFKYDSIVNGRDYDAGVYRGYYLPGIPTEGADTAVTEVKVGSNLALNIVERYYQAKTYNIVYKDCQIPANMPLKHTYDHDTVILNPVKTGYRFLGWTVENWDEVKYQGIPREVDCTVNNLVIGGTAYDHPDWQYETRDSDDLAIVLVARWEVVQNPVTYQDEFNNKDKLPTYLIYDEDFTLPNNMTRTGYTFLGWKIQGSEEEFRKDFVIPAGTSPLTPESLSFVAGWKANEYNVTLSPDAEELTSTNHDTRVIVTFDATLPAIVTPTREGYIFLGYYSGVRGSGKQYYNADGTCVEGVVWDKTESGAGSEITLYAYWAIDHYTVSVNGELLAVADVTVNGINYEGTPLSFDYNTAITVIVTFKDGENKKLVKWCGEAVAHTATFRYEFILKADTELTGEFAAAKTLPAFAVDYRSEIFTGAGGGKLPDGNYVLLCEGDEPVFFTVKNGTVSFENGFKTESLSAGGYFGSTVRIVHRGDGLNSADSDEQILILAARPDAPEINRQIASVEGLKRAIRIVMLQGSDQVRYEYACSPVRVTDKEKGLVWSGNTLFEDLLSGTTYYIYIRVAATNTSPHGEVYEIAVQTVDTSGDRDVDLTNVIAVLAVTLFCQIVAIILLAASRAKHANGKNVRTNGLALPVIALTVYYFPEHSLTIATILAVLVVICQVILTWLLVTSDIFSSRRKKAKKQENRKDQKDRKERKADHTEDPYGTRNEPTNDPYLSLWDEGNNDRQNSSNAGSYADPAQDRANDPADDYVRYAQPSAQDYEEEGADDIEDVSTETGYTEADDLFRASGIDADRDPVWGNAEEFPVDTQGTTNDVQNDWYGDQDDFIEPAPDPKYSIPEYDYGAQDYAEPNAEPEPEPEPMPEEEVAPVEEETPTPESESDDGEENIRYY